MTLVRLLYNLLFPVVLIVMLPGFLLRMVRRGKYRHKFGQRFAIYSAGVRTRLSDGRVWVHAVSVGEVLIALKLIRTMRQCDADLRFVLSTTTSTGFKLAARAKAPWLEPIYNPLDFYPVARRAVRLIRPSQLILVEAEAWPNLIAECRAAGASVAMVNARLSPRSERRYRIVKPLISPVWNAIDRLCLQEPEDVSRFSNLGVDPDRLTVTGSIKFDSDGGDARPDRGLRNILTAIGWPEGAPVLLGGSTFEGEEVLLARAFQQLRHLHPSLFLILVPRHVERAADVVRDVSELGLRVARRKQVEACTERPDVLVVDTTGELREWYACASVAFIGKSLSARGGQNPAEALEAGAAVLFGPHMDNFASLARQLIADHGALQVNDADGIFRMSDRLLSDPKLREMLVENGRECLKRHAGATLRTARILGTLREAGASTSR